MSNRFPMASHKKETCSCYRRCGRVAQLEAEAIAAEAARQLRLGESVHMFLLSARVCRRKMHQFSTPLKWLRLRCYAKYKLGDYQGAIADYDETIHLDPNNADARRALVSLDNLIN